MVLLGLSPPYAEEDVFQAYRLKAKELHPDRGGSASDFDALQKAFERAKLYLNFRSDRRRWIANQMEGYLNVREVIERFEDFGAEVTSDAIDWLEQSFGDFAQLTETITAIRLEGSASADEMIDYMVAHRDALKGLTRLELPDCQVCDESVLKLEPFQQLTHLDLSKTPITKDALWIVDTILGLESLELDGTRVGWWTRRKVRAVMRQRQDARPVSTIG